MKNRIFLGGTCAETTWRTELEKVLTVPSFNPVVEDWTPECMAVEDDEKKNKCNIHLYVITMAKSIYSIAEVVQSSLTKSKVTILHVMPDGFDKHELKHMTAICELVKNNGAIVYIDSELNRTARVINYSFA